MSRYTDICRELTQSPQRWLVTGAAGFIGSSIVERLLDLGQDVVGLDNFATGYQRNLDQAAGGNKPGRFQFIEGDIRELGELERAMQSVDFVLHQAALGSVPRSINNPLEYHHSNVSGFVNVLMAARDCEVKRVVYASSSSVYGDDPALPKQEDVIGHPLSPYALTKQLDEHYADMFHRVYGVDSVGLRYFNVFGPRQDPDGPYAAVIPRWLSALSRCEPCVIFGDGEQSRDFTYVEDAVQANILAATARGEAVNAVYNVARGSRTTLLELYQTLRQQVSCLEPRCAELAPEHRNPRPGDVRHSQADVARARELLGLEPQFSLAEGLERTVTWFLAPSQAHQPAGSAAAARASAG